VSFGDDGWTACCVGGESGEKQDCGEDGHDGCFNYCLGSGR
jgi:hypothetical protein